MGNLSCAVPWTEGHSPLFFCTRSRPCSFPHSSQFYPHPFPTHQPRASQASAKKGPPGNGTFQASVPFLQLPYCDGSWTSVLWTAQDNSSFWGMTLYPITRYWRKRSCIWHSSSSLKIAPAGQLCPSGDSHVCDRSITGTQWSSCWTDIATSAHGSEWGCREKGRQSTFSPRKPTHGRNSTNLSLTSSPTPALSMLLHWSRQRALGS